MESNENVINRKKKKAGLPKRKKGATALPQVNHLRPNDESKRDLPL
jgi:hypothetical protein